MSETNDNGEDNRLIAAEYVLGVLGVSERRAVELRLTNDRALAREVEFWEARLGPLADNVAPVPPPVTAWWKIEAAVAPPGSSAAARAKPGIKHSRKPGLWQSIGFWRGFAIASSGLA